MYNVEDLPEVFIENYEIAKKQNKPYFKIEGCEVKKLFTDRVCMICAIEMANLSNSSDKESLFLGEVCPQPKIGAVLVLDDTVYFSARSGMKHGDHAEYTLLESVHKGAHLNNAKLYTTLEPCTPASRSDWTESCAVLITNKKIKHVFVGSIDQNPLVLGNGLNILKEAKINIEFFDNDLSDNLKELNKDFFDFCSVKSDSKTIRLVDSQLKNKLDFDAIKLYLGIDKINNNALLEFYRMMIDKNQIFKGEFSGGVDVTYDFALAFFKNPSRKIPGYNISIVNKFNKKPSAKRKTPFDKSLIVLLSDCNNNLFKKIFAFYNNVFDDESKTFDDIYKEIYSSPSLEILRELLINSIVHNDFHLNPSVQIIIQKNLEIHSFRNNSNNISSLLTSNSMPSFPTNNALMEFLEQCKIVECENTCMNILQTTKFEDVYDCDPTINLIKTKITLRKGKEKVNDL